MEAPAISPDVKGKVPPETEEMINEYMREADDKLLKHVTEVMARTQEIASGIINGARRDADENAEQIITESREIANQIIHNAKLKAKKEARIRIDSATKVILRDAKEEAIRIISKARQEAERESTKILSGNSAETKTDSHKDRLTTWSKDMLKKITKYSAAIRASVKNKNNSSDKVYGEVLVTLQKSPIEELKLKTDPDRLYQGNIRLDIPQPIDYSEVIILQSYLHKIDNLRISSVGGSIAGNTTIIVDIEKPMPLVRILEEMKSLRTVYCSGENRLLLLTSLRL